MAGSGTARSSDLAGGLCKGGQREAGLSKMGIDGERLRARERETVGMWGACACRVRGSCRRGVRAWWGGASCVRRTWGVAVWFCFFLKD